MNAEEEMAEKRGFERMNNMTACKSYMKHEDVLEQEIICLWIETKQIK